MSGLKIFLISLILSLLIILLAGGAWFLLAKKPDFSAFLSKEPQKKADFVLSESVIQLPYPLNDTRAGGVGISYLFTGMVTDLRPASGGTELFLDQTGLPKLIIEPDVTRFSFLNQEKRQYLPTQQSSLKIGDQVNVIVNYDLRKKIWVLWIVSILNQPPAREATSSAVN